MRADKRIAVAAVACCLVATQAMSFAQDPVQPAPIVGPTYKRYEGGGTKAVSRIKAIYRKCSVSSQLRADGDKVRRNRYGNLRLDLVERRIRAIWKTKKPRRICAMIATTQDNKIFFPTRATSKSKKSGYFDDPFPRDSQSSMVSFGIFFKKRR